MIPKAITLLLMTEKGLAFAKKALSEYSDSIQSVVIGQDRAVANDYSSDIASLCEKYGVNYTFREDSMLITSQFVIAVSWRWLIDHPQDKLIVFHDSLLPRYRGFAPLVNSLINGEHVIGVTALFGAAEYDKGQIITQESISISYPITVHEAIEKLTSCYIAAGDTVLKRIAAGLSLDSYIQDESNASYSLWRDDNDYRINWSKSSAEIRRTVDALGHPFKGASCLLNGEQCRILQVEECADVRIENRDIGKVIFLRDMYPVVVCGVGLLVIKQCFSEAGVDLLPLAKFRSRFE
ncbi:methionyl-tRNA formyltransferase [Pseudomonas sp. S31]|uniref:formyltransferase family protein n=1 Tax=Pseudomonas sp. S31 TaxID=1564473 RepID=UPI0019135FAA|nr:formyltransferase family protein [Pseudomonas sp. S31]MBK5002880.1 methionyl-tRNA formyltransferase [Pseudomonas sp. S31]